MVHRAWQEEGEGQYKIHKTRDWVEEVKLWHIIFVKCLSQDFNGLNERMAWATKLGFKGSATVALVDIFLVKMITERKAQLARCCFQSCMLSVNYSAHF